VSSPVARLFDRVSKVYDTPLLQALVYRPAQDLALRRLRAAGVKRVLDVGCGTGIFTTRMRDELGLDVVCGCDLSEGMLGQAHARSSDVGWTRGDATRLPLGDESVDAVVCTEAFHFFDQPAALAEFYRVLRAGGMVLVAMINPRTEVGSALLKQNAVFLGAGTWPSRRRMHDLVEEAGFAVTKQHRVSRLMSRALPTVLTEATKR
jgi:ubiquinone/menaquinone biosynthesis C-methylase UbiE